MEACDNFQNFVLYHSVSGGCGSGLASLIMERISVDYGRKYKMSLTNVPSPSMEQSPLESYNAILSIHSLLEHTDNCFFVDNEAMFNISQQLLKV